MCALSVSPVACLPECFLLKYKVCILAVYQVSKYVVHILTYLPYTAVTRPAVPARATRTPPPARANRAPVVSRAPRAPRFL